MVLNSLVPKNITIYKYNMLSRVLLTDMCRLSTIAYRDANLITDLFEKRHDNRPHTNEMCVLDQCHTSPELLQSYLSSETSLIQNDCQAYACRYRDSLTIVFRGTESFRDVLADLNMIRVRMDLPSISGNNRPKVHWGFLRQFRTIESQVRDHITRYLEEDSSTNPNPKKIIFSGHSLGGALGTLASVQFGLENPNVPITCITFGSPRVGNSSFATMFDRCVQHSYRYVNEDDPVPMGPTPLRFRHVKGGQWIEDDMLLTQKPWMRSVTFIKNLLLSVFGITHNPIGDHSCSKYLHFISNHRSIPPS